MNFCGNCGARVKEGQKICTQCGHPSTQSVTQTHNRTTTKIQPTVIDHSMIQINNVLNLNLRTNDSGLSLLLSS